MASRRGEMEADNANLDGFRPDSNDLQPEIPRFEDYFKAKAQGVHPFDRTINS